MNNYSLLRSKTFWTVVFMFVFNGYAAISGQLPGDVTLIVNTVLSVIASIFHLETGKSTTGAN